MSYEKFLVKPLSKDGLKNPTGPWECGEMIPHPNLGMTCWSQPGGMRQIHMGLKSLELSQKEGEIIGAPCK